MALKQRIMIDGSIFSQARPSTDQIISDLRTELTHTQAQLVDARYELAQARAHIAVLKRELSTSRAVAR